MAVEIQQIIQWLKDDRDRGTMDPDLISPEVWELYALVDHIEMLQSENERLKRGQMCGFCQGQTPDEVFDPKCPECKGKGISYRYE